MGETSKACARRQRTGWFERYAPAELPGIDIGCGSDPLNQTFRRFDSARGDGDATLMDGTPDETFTTVYASHVLEHLHEPERALANWWRILKPGGHLIVLVPHRDLYERRTELPSRWNGDHKTFWLPETEEPPVTRGLRQTIARAIGSREIVLSVLRDGWQEVPEHVHPLGEYSIEAIVRKDAR